MIRLWTLCLFWLGLSVVAAQGDGLNLPTDLYVLLNSGVVERYGVGAAGVETTTPEDVFILDFAVAPDGNWMAYRTEDGISLLNLPDGAVTSLGDAEADVPSVRGRGQTMVWSPDGTALAYTTTFGLRVAFNIGEQPVFANVVVSPLHDLIWSPDGAFLAAEAEQNVWWIYRREGDAMFLTSAIPYSSGATWLDSSRLIFAPAEGGLLTMDMVNANAQAPLQDNSRIYERPFRRPDGSLVVFSRPSTATDLDPQSGSYQQLLIEGGAVRVSDSSDNVIDLTGLRWAPGGELLISLLDGSLALVLPTSGEAFTLPIEQAVAYGWGAARSTAVTGVSLTSDGFFLAPATDGVAIDGVIQVWRLPANGLPPVMITGATTDITDFAISDNNVAYAAGDVIWLQSLASTSSASELVQTAARDLAFNVGGDTLAYSTTGGLWLLNAVQGSEPRLILTNDELVSYGKPQFAPNFNAILVQRTTGDLAEYLIYDPVSEEFTVVGAFPAAEWLSDGRVMGFTAESVEVVDTLSGAAETMTVLRAGNSAVLDVEEVAAGQLQAVLGGEALPGRGAYSLVQVAVNAGEPDEIGTLEMMTEPQISPDGAFVVGYVQPDGVLVVYSVSRNEHVILDAPTGVTLFRWITFR